MSENNNPASTDPGNQDPNQDPANQGDPNQDPNSQPDPNDKGDAELGDAGKKAIKAERDARKAAEKTAQENAAKLTELEAELARLRRSNAAQKGTDLEAIKTEIRAEYAAQIAETAIKAEAKGRLNDPADALLYIKPADVNGEDAIKAAVDQLLKDKPYLGVPESGPKPWGDVGGGQRKTTEAEPKSAVERMARAYGSKG